MNKTVHLKLTDKFEYTHASCHAAAHDMPVSILKQELKLMRAAAADLLQPRPEAIDKLLQLARSL